MKKWHYVVIALFVFCFSLYIFYLTQRVTLTKTRLNMTDVEKTVWDFYLASKNGDVDLYLGTFTSDSYKIAETSIKKMGREQFSRYIKQMMANINGLTIKSPEAFENNNDNLKIIVELVLDTRQEDCTFYMQNTKSGWKIARLSNPTFIIPPDSFGTKFK